LTFLKQTPHAPSSANPFRPSRTGQPFHGQLFNKQEHISSWLHEQKKFYDIQPDRDYVIIPVAFKKRVYDMYLKDLNEQVSLREGLQKWQTVSKAMFYRVWKRDVKGLRCSKFHRFMICDTCCTINQKLIKQALTVEERAKWQKMKDVHLWEVRNDRALYECRILEAIRMRSAVLSITIDGSDNSKYGIPYFPVKTHDSQKGHKIITKLYGAIVHGRWAGAYLYTGNMPGGTNVTVEILHRVLSALKREDGHLPRKMYLQLDNTVSTNKSKYLKAFLKFLVDCGVLDEVLVYYFQVGHTHCDIDQIWSRVAIYLIDKVIITFQDLLDAVKMALSGMDGWVKHAERITHFGNWRDTIEPYLQPASVWNGITKFRVSSPSDCSLWNLN
jgi:hypothetical protein